ncbi:MULTISPECIES: hypothetical protein [unclassified Coleofasciculus]|uniref:hypothetical protein n=1 Tax=Cyanophyceae TaxID=3028117 RepID=UPI0016849D2D|nr:MULTISPECIES: hypothetical protein [unclassified Coleofasciculus]MBD1881546.1 hypothetical protein [Coleofasciculus sp. FACHB-T130]MBD1902918.1 hypothetical protein [Coleofasciculus sp. FACHB-125]
MYPITKAIAFWSNQQYFVKSSTTSEIAFVFNNAIAAVTESQLQGTIAVANPT